MNRITRIAQISILSVALFTREGWAQRRPEPKFRPSTVTHIGRESTQANWSSETWRAVDSRALASDQPQRPRLRSYVVTGSVVGAIVGAIAGAYELLANDADDEECVGPCGPFILIGLPVAVGGAVGGAVGAIVYAVAR